MKFLLKQIVFWCLPEKFWEDTVLTIHSSSCTHIPLSLLLSQPAQGAGQVWSSEHVPVRAAAGLSLVSEPGECWSRELDWTMCKSLTDPLEDKELTVAWAGSCCCFQVWESSRNWLSGELPPHAPTAQPALRGKVFVFLLENEAHYIPPTHIMGPKKMFSGLTNTSP